MSNENSLGLVQQSLLDAFSIKIIPYTKNPLQSALGLSLRILPIILKKFFEPKKMVENRSSPPSPLFWRLLNSRSFAV